MATPAQAAAATVGAGSLAAAGAYGITQAVKGEEGEEQTTEESAEDNTAPTAITFKTTELSTYTNKTLSFLKDDHLTKLVKALDENNKWWDWAFKNRYSNKEGLTLEATFNNVTDSTSLKNSCNNAYKKEKAYFNTDNFLENIGVFCTSEKLSTLEPKATVYQNTEATTGYTDGLLNITENKSNLIKTTIGSGTTLNNSDLWWNWAFKNIFSKQTEAKSTTFQAVNKGYSESEATALSKVCDDSYKKDYANLKNDEWKLLKEIKKFCSINKENTELLLPEPKNPTAVSSTSSYTDSNALAKKNGNKEKLVAATNNDNWWEWSFNRNYPKDEASKAKLPDPFKNITKPTAEAASDENQQTGLNQACDKAYNKSKNPLNVKVGNDGKTVFEWVKILCSPSSKSQSLELPSA